MLFSEYEEERDFRIGNLEKVVLDEDLDCEEVLKALETNGEYKTIGFQVSISYEPADVTIGYDAENEEEIVIEKQLPIFHYQGRA